MKNISFAYLMFAGVSAAIAGFSFYMVYLAATGQSNGTWLFAAMGLLFSVLPAFALIRILGSKSEFFARIDKTVSPVPAEPRSAGFAPHWMMLFGMIVIALIIVSIVINIIKSLF